MLRGKTQEVSVVCVSRTTRELPGILSSPFKRDEKDSFKGSIGVLQRFRVWGLESSWVSE